MVYTSPLTFHNDVKDDLAAIKGADEVGHAHLVALLRQLKADQKLAEKLLDHGFGDDKTAEVSVNKWLNQWKTGKDLWRLKSWDMEAQGLQYRVIYLYLPSQARFVVMAVVKRGNFNYDDKDHPITKRIVASLQRTYGIE